MKPVPTIIVCLVLLCAVGNETISASSREVPLGLGERADWLRGSWGINWKPAKRDNGIVETLSADAFLDQIAGLRTLDYVQLHLNESYTSSPVHWGPHAILESLWQGNTDAHGDPINLVVPRAAAGVNPFLIMLKAVKMDYKKRYVTPFMFVVLAVSVTVCAGEALPLSRLPVEAKDSTCFKFVPKVDYKNCIRKSGETHFTTAYEPSGSSWGQACNEEDVYLARLKHSAGANDSWDLRIGQGGADLFIYWGLWRRRTAQHKEYISLGG